MRVTSPVSHKQRFRKTLHDVGGRVKGMATLKEQYFPLYACYDFPKDYDSMGLECPQLWEQGSN